MLAADMMKLMNTGPTIPPAEAMVDAMHAAIPFGQSTGVLDVGCGTGLGTGLLLERHGAALPSGARVLATDFAANLVEQIVKLRAEEIEKGNAAWERVEPARMDAQDLSSLGDGSFTHIMAGFVLFMVSDPQKALRDCLRVLAPEHGGGVLAQTSWRQADWIDLLREALEEAGSTVPMAMPPKAWLTVEGVRGEMEAAGFREVRVTEVETFMKAMDPNQMSEFMITKMCVVLRCSYAASVGRLLIRR